MGTNPFQIIRSNRWTGHGKERKKEKERGLGD